MEFGISTAAAVMAAVISTSAQAATYTSDAAFTAAASGTTLTTQSFENAPTGSGSSLNFGNVTVSVAGNNYPSFFQRFDSSQIATDGRYSILFATPDTITFAFAAPITTFGIDLVDLGNPGPTTFSVDVGTGAQTLFSDYTGTSLNRTFAGVIDQAGFSQLTFRGTRDGDGVVFDRLRFGGSVIAVGAAVPEPSSWALMIVGFGLVGAAMRRRRQPALRYA